MVTGHVLANELCTRKDFVKFPAGAVRHLNPLAPEGLFTADHGEEFWELAHRVLVPAFGPMSVRSMFPGAATRPLAPRSNPTPMSLFLVSSWERIWERISTPRLTRFAEMHDIVSQLAMRWGRFGEDEPIDVVSDFTRLTLDTIAL